MSDDPIGGRPRPLVLNGDPLGLDNTAMNEVLLGTALSVCRFFLEEGREDKAATKAEAFLSLAHDLEARGPVGVNAEWIRTLLSDIENFPKDYPELKTARDVLVRTLERTDAE